MQSAKLITNTKNDNGQGVDALQWEIARLQENAQLAGDVFTFLHDVLGPDGASVVAERDLHLSDNGRDGLGYILQHMAALNYYAQAGRYFAPNGTGHELDYPDSPQKVDA